MFFIIFYIIFSKIKQKLNLHLLKKKITIFKFVKIIKNLATVFQICLER